MAITIQMTGVWACYQGYFGGKFLFNLDLPERNYKENFCLEGSSWDPGIWSVAFQVKRGEEGKVTDPLGLLRKLYGFYWFCCDWGKVIDEHHSNAWFANEWGETPFMASEIVLEFIYCLLSAFCPAKISEHISFINALYQSIVLSLHQLPLHFFVASLCKTWLIGRLLVIRIRRTCGGGYSDF